MEICSSCKGTGLNGNCPDCDGAGFSRALNSRVAVSIGSLHDKANQVYKTLETWVSDKPGSDTIIDQLKCDYVSLKSTSNSELYDAVGTFITHVNVLVHGSHPTLPITSHTIPDRRKQACANLREIIKTQSFGYRGRSGTWFSAEPAVARVRELMEIAGDAISDLLRNDIQTTVFPPPKKMRRRQS
jgi:hypothetical protein